MKALTLTDWNHQTFTITNLQDIIAVRAETVTNIGGSLISFVDGKYQPVTESVSKIKQSLEKIGVDTNKIEFKG